MPDDALRTLSSRPLLQAPGERPASQARTRARPRRRLFGLTLRILVTNVLVLLLLVLSLMWLDFLRDSLIDQKLKSVQTEAEMIAGALAELGLSGPDDGLSLDVEKARTILHGVAIPDAGRVRLYGVGGELLVDTRFFAAHSRRVQLRYLPPPDVLPGLDELLGRLYDWGISFLPRAGLLRNKEEAPDPTSIRFPELESALVGRVDGSVRRYAGGEMLIAVAVPIQQLRQVRGALLLTADGADIEAAVRRGRVQLLQFLAVGLAFTVLLSLFLAGTIARPLRRLAQAAERVRRRRAGPAELPDYSRRRDEIGDLSQAFRDMTTALSARLDAIESFAADVAHEIRNPLASLRAALAALERTEDPARRAQLLAILRHDLERTDRLIGDISNASRVDAEMSRATREPVDLAALAETALEIRRGQAEAGRQEGGGQEGGPRFELAAMPGRRYLVHGIPGRIGQVVDNLLSNAASFSPPGGCIRIVLGREDRGVSLSVEDEGPGIDEGEAERLFQRFYSRRPPGEAFGQHSGLGLSIARQIVEAHGGAIHAENRRGPDGGVAGARFTIWLPGG